MIEDINAAINYERTKTTFDLYKDVIWIVKATFDLYKDDIWLLQRQHLILKKTTYDFYKDDNANIS